MRQFSLVICGLILLVNGNALAEKLAKPEASWVDGRVEEAKSRLSKSKAGMLVWESIEAHGGLKRWFNNGPLHFRFAYSPVGKGQVRDTFQTIDTWSSRARHQLPDNRAVEFGWDGKTAWFVGDTQTNARFWSLTPYYFVAVPFVFADDGINLSLDGELKFEGKTYDLVRITYGENVGDSPDDYYVVLIDQKTKLSGGVRYIVSYKGFFKDGGSSPEKLLTFDGEQKVGDIIFPKTFRSFKWIVPDGKKDTGTGAPGKDVEVNTTLTDVEFRPGTTDAYFTIPKGAAIQEKM